MKKIGQNLYIQSGNVNSAGIFSKDGKMKVCFQMKQGDPVFSDAMHGESAEEQRNYAETLIFSLSDGK